MKINTTQDTTEQGKYSEEYNLNHRTLGEYKLQSLLSRCRDALPQSLLLHLLLGDWLLLSWREGLLCIGVEHIISNEECQQQPSNNQENY